MKKSILALLLAVLMVASLLPAAAMADGEVAMLGNAKYATLQEAIDEAEGDNNEVVLIANTNENVTIAADKNIVLDLNGFTLDGSTTQSQAALTNKGTVVIKDSSAAGTGTIKRSDNGPDGCYYTVYNYSGTMTIESGNIENNAGSPTTWSGSSLINNGLEAEATLIINGGNISQDYFIAVKNDEMGTLVINDGIISSKTQAVQNWLHATIEGGTMTGDVTTWAYLSVAGDTTINGGTIDGNVGAYWFNEYSSYPTTEGTVPAVTMTGGTMTGKFLKASTSDNVHSYPVSDNDPKGSIAVEGGQFSNAVNPIFLDKSLQYQVKNGNTYTYYDTFTEALNHAQNGAEIEYVVEGVGAQHYYLTIDPANGGTVLSYKLPSGSPYTLPTVTKSGYAFLGWSDGVNTYPAGTVITLTSNVTYTASWVRHPDTPYVPEPEEPEEPEVPEFPFYDVPTSAWYYTAVKYVYDNKLMDGVDTYVFAPNDTLTRAMVWTIIARMSGVDTTGGNSWYAKAQEWVITNGISDGENPTAAITREEFVTMLWRLAGEPIYTGDLSRVPDAGSISTWAQNAMLWSYATGLTEGDENGALTPLATATRAQAAAMIMRFCESVK